MPEALFCVPHKNPTRLVGRAEVLRELHGRLTGEDEPTLLTALQGTGGIGKTQLAARYCYEYCPHWTGGILWLSMADPARLLNDLAQLAERQGIAGDGDRAKANALLGRIAGRRDSLLVLDNLEEAGLLDRDLPGLAQARPRGLGCRLLITSRQPELPGCRALRLDFLPQPLAKALLLREARPKGSIEEGCIEEDCAALNHLLSILGGLPLALVMAGRLLQEKRNLRVVELVEALKSLGAVEVLSRKGRTVPEDYHEKIGLSIQAVMVQAWDALPADRPLLQDVLRALGCLAENAFVPEAVLPLMVNVPPVDPLDFGDAPVDAALRWLDAAQLVERNQAGEVRLHSLIHDFAANRADAAFRTVTTERVRAGLADPKTYSGHDLPILLRFAIDLDRQDGIAGSGTEAAAALRPLIRMLSAEAQNLRRGVDVPFSVTAQLDHAATLHGVVDLKAATVAAAAERPEPHLTIRWTTARASGAARHRLAGHESSVLRCAISADGRVGLSASEDRTLIVWDLQRGSIRQRLVGHKDQVLSCAISADGRTGLSGSDDRTLILWDLQSGAVRYRLKGHKAGVAGCAISADGRTGLSGSSDERLIVWDLASGAVRLQLEGHEDWIENCAISADGHTGLSASKDRTVIVWDLQNGVIHHRLKGHTDTVLSCAISADGRTGLSASEDNTLMVWDLYAGAERHCLTGHEDWVRGCAISADCRIGLSASDDRTVIVWDLQSGAARHRYREHEGVVLGCAISADGRTGLSACNDCTLILWDVATAAMAHRQGGHGAAVLGCAISADGRTGFSASHDSTLIVWELGSGAVRHRLKGHPSPVWGCAISADGRTGLSVGQLCNPIVWDLANGAVRLQLSSGWDNIPRCAISSDGRTGLASDNHTLTVWDLHSGAVRHRLTGHEGWVSGCAVSADGRIGLACNDCFLIVWDLESGTVLHRLTGHEGWISGCVVTADGHTGFSASHDRTLIVWDLQSGSIRHRLAGHEGRVKDCAISADGRTGLSGSDDRTLTVWDLGSGAVRHRLALDAVPYAVSINLEARVALVGDAKGNVTLFELVLP